MFEAAVPQGISPLRLSFVATLKILRCRLPECPQSRPALRQWYEHLLAEVGEEVIAKRRDRVNPRVINIVDHPLSSTDAVFRGCPGGSMGS